MPWLLFASGAQVSLEASDAAAAPPAGEQPPVASSPAVAVPEAVSPPSSSGPSPTPASDPALPSPRSDSDVLRHLKNLQTTADAIEARVRQVEEWTEPSFFGEMTTSFIHNFLWESLTEPGSSQNLLGIFFSGLGCLINLARLLYLLFGDKSGKKAEPITLLSLAYSGVFLGVFTIALISASAMNARANVPSAAVGSPELARALAALESASDKISLWGEGRPTTAAQPDLENVTTSIADAIQRLTRVEAQLKQVDTTLGTLENDIATDGHQTFQTLLLLGLGVLLAFAISRSR